MAFHNPIGASQAHAQDPILTAECLELTSGMPREHAPSVASGTSLLAPTALKTFLAATIGYSLFYVCRLSLSVMKEPLLGENLFTELQLGIIGAALFYSYAVGKLVNGFLADSINVRKFAAWGLFISAAINLRLGFHVGFLFFFILWLVNGWVQSIGAPSFILGMTRWFTVKERGTYYGLWSSSHNIGEGLTFVLTAVVITHLGWREGWWLSAGIGFLGVLIIWLFFHEKPAPANQAVPIVTDPAVERREARLAHWKLLKEPTVWLISLASMFMYISRYSMNSWGIFFLEKAKGYSIEESSMIISVASIFGVLGTVSSGWISDRYFDGNRSVPVVVAGLINAFSLTLFLLSPHLIALDLTCMIAFGVTIGALLCYLGGLMAVDIADKHATGAALGIVGMASYAGAGTQDIFSGYLIGANKSMVDGVSHYNFLPAEIFWITSVMLSVVISTIAWKYQRERSSGGEVEPLTPAESRSN